MRVIVSRLLVLSYLHRIRPTFPPTKDGKKQRHVPGPISNSGPTGPASSLWPHHLHSHHNKTSWHAKPHLRRVEDGSSELELLESCGPYRAESNVINMERQKHKRRSLLECRAVVTANLLWALSLSLSRSSLFSGAKAWLLVQVSFFRWIKQRRSGWSLRNFSWAKFQCSISPVSEQRKQSSGV